MNSARRSAVLALLIFFAAGVAQAQRPERVAQALRERYGNTQTEIVGTPRDINGIRVFEVDVRSPQGSSQANVTEFGDFLSGGAAADFRKLPQSVQQVRELFRGSPVNVDSYVADSYQFDIRRAEGRVYRLRFDAVGRIREIQNPDEVERADMSRLERPSDEVARRITELAQRHLPQRARLRDVYKDPQIDDFYMARYVLADGKDYVISLDNNGTVLSSRTQVDQNDIPGPIRDAFTRMFDPSKVSAVYRSRGEFVQFQQKTDLGDVVTFRIRPDGTVMDVRSTQLLDEERATMASQRTRNEANPPRNAPPDRNR